MNLVFNLFAARLEKIAGTKLTRATLLLDPATMIVNGRYTRKDTGETRDGKPQKIEADLIASLISKGPVETPEKYSMEFDYTTRKLVSTVFGTDGNGQKVSFEETIDF